MCGRADMCGGSAEDCTEQLKFVGEEIEGGCFAAGAGEGCDAGADGEQFSEFHMAVFYGWLVVLAVGLLYHLRGKLQELFRREKRGVWGRKS